MDTVQLPQAWFKMTKWPAILLFFIFFVCSFIFLIFIILYYITLLLLSKSIFFSGFIHFATIEKYFFALRDDTHMTSMKIGQFSRTSTLLSSYFQNSFTHLTSDVQFQTKRKHNPRMTIASYQVFPSGRLLFSVSTH